MTKEHNLIVVGPPCCGKSTQSRRLSDVYSLNHLSTGDLLLKNADVETPYGSPSEYLCKGELVPDPVVNDLVDNELPPKNYVLDGYPRTETQAEFIVQETDLTGCIHLTAPKDVLVSRAAQRRVCSVCGTSYDGTEGTNCPDCGSDSYRRPDDSEESFMQRYEAYGTHIDAVISTLERTCPVALVNAEGDREDIWREIQIEVDNFQ